MENSEDDAGTATNASRRGTAREKDIEQAETVDATSSLQESAPNRTSSEGLAMSEDNFDGDSVPSPTTQDVNTSTEAILDMIDEIVDGPGAPKRLPHTLEHIETGSECAQTSEEQPNHEQEASKSNEGDNLTQHPVTPPASSANCENVSHNTKTESTRHNELSQSVNSVAAVDQPLASSSVQHSDQVVICSEKPSEYVEVSCESVFHNIPSSSVVETVQNVVESGSQLCERTVKHVTSSDTQDNVTVESAESTSSDSNVSAGIVVVSEPNTRLPLRRRLVRPAPYDRRPDSTVSSTVDSQTVDHHSMGDNNGDSVTKDVSSSSDAVTTVHGNVKPQEVSVSEINICKAETSTSPVKKIKLVRQKSSPTNISRDNILDKQISKGENEQCQSTSDSSSSIESVTCPSSSKNSISVTNESGRNSELTIEPPVIEPQENTLQVNCLSETSSSAQRTENLVVESVNTSLEQPDEPKSNLLQDACTSHSNLHTKTPCIPEILPSTTNVNSDVVNINELKDCESNLVSINVASESNLILEGGPSESASKLSTKQNTSLCKASTSNLNKPTHCVSNESHLEKQTDCAVSISSSLVVSDDVNIKGNTSLLIDQVQLQPSTNQEPSSYYTSSTTKFATENEAKQKVPPIKLNLITPNAVESSNIDQNIDKLHQTDCTEMVPDPPENTKQVPKLTIKLGNKKMEEMKSPIPKLTIKPIKHPTNDQMECPENIPSVTKINIKPIRKQPEKINDVHRKSSSSEISESEYSENDESTSTSDQASASDQGSSDVVPKVTIKLGKPGTECEGKFYTEKNIPKLTIKNIHHNENDEQESVSKLKLIISQSEDKQLEKIPKLTIKTVAKSDGQPLSPKLTIKPLKPPENVENAGEVEMQQIPKIKICTESLSSSMTVKENVHVPKITIKPVIKTDSDVVTKTPKKSMTNSDIAENIPTVTKLNIKPVLKPLEGGEKSDCLGDKVPVVSKLNIKPILKPKDNEVESSVEDVPKVTKLNIKLLKNPEVNTSEQKDCDALNAKIDDNSIPIVTKLNIKPIIKPLEEDISKDSENQSSETGNSSDDNTDNIPVVTKLNIKPILKPNEPEESSKPTTSNDNNIPVVTKLNIKPIIKPDENVLPLSPKKEIFKNIDNRNFSIPVVTKLNIKPIINPEEAEKQKVKEDNDDNTIKNPPLVMKINRKTVADSNLSEDSYKIDNKVNSIDDKHEQICNNANESITLVSKLNIKPIVKPVIDASDEDMSAIKPDIVAKSINTSLGTSKQVNDNTLKEVTELLSPKHNCIGNEEKNYKNCQIPQKITPFLEKVKTTADVMFPVNRNTSLLPQEVKDKSELSVHPSLLSKTKDDLCQIEEESKKTAKNIKEQATLSVDVATEQISNKQLLQNCVLLKKLLETKSGSLESSEKTKAKVSHVMNESLISEPNPSTCKDNIHCNEIGLDQVNIKTDNEPNENSDIGKTNEISSSSLATKVRTMQDLCKDANDSVTKPLEITISEKVQSSDQDSPRIILKINKTYQGPAAKIITEDSKKLESSQPTYVSENTQEIVNDRQSQKRNLLINSRRKLATETSPVLGGKRLRSSRIVENTEKTSGLKKHLVKRPSLAESSPPNKETELSVLETKRLKLGQLLSNQSLTITPLVSKAAQISPTNHPCFENKQITKGSETGKIVNQQSGRSVNHSILNNENCSKNGNSKLHNILSNLQAKQLQVKPLNCSEKKQTITPETESSISGGSSDVIEIVPVGNSIVQEMIISENSDSHDFAVVPDELSQDPLQMDTPKILSEEKLESSEIIKPVDMTPQPKKRGRPRKIPLSEGAKPVPVLPISALEERPQRSLRLSRDRPTILAKPRGRGRGRAKRIMTSTPPEPEPVVATANKFFVDEQKSEPIDPTSSRIKLPRMTEALDNMPSVCSTPLSSRRRESSELKLFGEPQELKVVLDAIPKLEDSFTKSPESVGEMRGRGGRGSRGGRYGRGRTPRGSRGRGRGRGGGRGAMYMKETMGIYGRVCGPATTSVQLFEEETCMMDDNATPAKPSHLLDEDSQSSVKSSTNESSKMKKSKFADLFDSNKVWTAADVKEYVWPPPDQPAAEHQVMMVQEQVAMFLGVKSFKRRYPELKRRTIAGAEREYVLGKGLVTEALCDLGVTAVDASEILDIMLSDYPHKYEEYRSHQRQRQIMEAAEETAEESKPDVKEEKLEPKQESKPVEQKPEVPKVDPEKTRQDMAAAAIASASEYNSRINASRRPACVDLQTLTVHRRRAPPVTPPAAPPTHVRPPAGFYPHALLPGQYQHWYRLYTADQLRYFPLNTCLAAPPAPPSPEISSESEQDCSSSSSSDDCDRDRLPAKRKKLTKVKRSSQTEGTLGIKKEEDSREAEVVDLCKVCKLRLEANRKYTHERFLVCANCNAKLHPSCLELSADTIRKCREYPWQCAECKSCCTCHRPADDDKMLFCDLCDRGFHIYCVGLQNVPSGRWHCEECAICKSCGARDPNGLTPGGAAAGPSGSATPGPSGSATPGPSGSGGEWHHQTRRGPGGHKVYSHSLCTPCARAYRIGRYCPLCDRSFIGPKGTMQLVICKLCDRQLHQECVRQTVSTLNVLDHTCGECRRGGITSRAAAVRLAPRTIATLFMAKRRFNKYAHRQYLASRAQGPKPAPDEAPSDHVERADDASEASESADPLDVRVDFGD